MKLVVMLHRDSDWCRPMPSTEEILIRRAATARLRRMMEERDKSSQVSNGSTS